METFGRRVQRLRQDLDITQEELRDKMMAQSGVSVGQTYISQMEKRNKRPMLEVATALARALNTSVDYLALLTDDPAPARDHPPYYFTPEADEAARSIDTLVEEDRQVVLSVVRAAVAQFNQERRTQKVDLAELLALVERNSGTEARRVVERQLGIGGRFPSTQP